MRTRITELLGTKYPIIQAPTNPIAIPRLVAAVSNAGGLGILASGRLTPEEVKEDIKVTRDQTDKPFGVNLLAGTPGYEKIIEMLIEERVPVICHGRGNPKGLINTAKGCGIIIMPMIGAIRHAVRAEQDGADALIVQGLEAGGHTSHVATMVLLPLVTSMVKIPVVAAGGFCDGKGLVAALALGADGIAMGTRFATTQESPIPSNVKRRYIESSENDTIVTSAITGTGLRVIRNRFVDALEQEGQRLSWKERVTGTLTIKKALGISWWQFLLGGWRMRKEYEASVSELDKLAAGVMRVKRALVEGDVDYGVIPSGQVCGRIEDIPSIQDLIERIVNEAKSTLESVREKVAS
jgi:NAD(P)H-dependent flavin oxidoreductase YrpB (nitropropane dioxygenase family)